MGNTPTPLTARTAVRGPVRERLTQDRSPTAQTGQAFLSVRCEVALEVPLLPLTLTYSASNDVPPAAIARVMTDTAASGVGRPARAEVAAGVRQQTRACHRASSA